MRKLFKIFLILVIFFIINMIIIRSFDFDNKIFDTTNTDSDSISANVSKNDVTSIMLTSALSIIEGVILLTIENVVNKTKQDNNNSPYIKLLVKSMSGIRKNDTQRGIPKIKMNFKANLEFVYVYVRMLNSGKKTIYNCRIKDKILCKNGLHPGEEVLMVFSVYRSSFFIKNLVNTFKIQYTDENDIKYKGIYLLVTNQKQNKASLKIFLKQRRI